MNHLTQVNRRHNLRAFVAALITYVMLAGQVAPLALAASPARAVPPSESAPPVSVSFTQRPVPAPLPPGGGGTQAGSPTITATKTDAWDDTATPDGKAEPGQTITYTVTISNTGTGDATNVQFNDSVDTNTSLVNGSVNTQPIATDDTYTAVGNVRIQPNAAQGLLANDRDPDTGNNTGLTASGPSTSTQGGNLTINADGSFIYNPAPGFAGADTFTYTITDAGGKTDTATATIQVGNGTNTPGTNVVWFVNPSAPSGGDGRLTNPFNCYTGVSASCFSQTAADDPGDAIFLFSGSHTGGNTLLNNQKLIGAGASDTLANIAGLTPPAYSDALPSTGGASPTITTSNVNAIPLAQGNLLRGFTVGNVGTGTKISGTNFGTLTVGNSTTPDVTLNGTGQALNLSTGTLSVTGKFSSVTTTSSSAQGINLAGVADSDGAGGSSFSFGSTTISGSTTQGILIGTTTADINFGNTSVTGGTDGVSFQNNSAGTRTFGTLGVSGGSGIAFLSGAGGGNVTVTGAATLSSAGNAVDIQSLAASTAVNFQSSVSATRTAAGGTGVNLASNNATSTITFNSLTIDTNAGTGLSATGGGTVNVTNNTGTINSTPEAAPAIVANGVTLNANFSSIASSGGTNGVSLTNVAGTSNFGTGSLTGASGTEFFVSGSNPTISYSGTITQNNAQRVVDIQGTTGNTITLSGTITGGASSTGVHIGDTSAVNGNVSFTTLNLGTSGSRMTSQAVTITNGGSGATYALGTVSIFTNNAQGIGATNFDGTLNSTAGTVDTTNNRAIIIDGPAGKTTLGMTLTTVNSTSAPVANPNGITIQDTDGTFSIVGNAGACTLATQTCTGGSIQSANQSGILLNNAAGISLALMKIQNSGQDGINATTVNGLTLNNSIVTDVNTVGSVNGTVNDNGLDLNNISGTLTVSNSVIDQAPHNGIFLTNTGTNLTALNVTNSTFSNMPNVSTSNNGILVVAATTSVISAITVTNSTFTNIFATGIQVDTNDTSTNSNITIGGATTALTNHFTNNNIAMNFTQAQAGNATVNVLNNTDINGHKSVVINFATSQSGTGGGFTGKIQGNTIGTNGTKDSGSATGQGLRLNLNGTPHSVFRVDSNTINEIPNARAIEALCRLGSGGCNLKFTNNTVHAPTGTNQTICDGVTTTPCPLAPLYIEANSGNTACVVVSGNTTYNPQPIGFGGEFAYYLHEGNTAPTPHHIQIENNGGDANAAAAVTNHNTPNSPVQIDAGVSLVAANTCGSFPAEPDTTGGTTSDGPPPSGTVAPPEQPAAAAQTSGVTSRPFVSLARPALRPAASAVGSRTLAPSSSGATGSSTQPSRSTTPVTRIVPNPQGSGGTVSVNIGTLRAGDSVTITFQVVIDNPYSGGPNVSNQGTVSGSNFSNVLTDDPAVGGTADPTLTPINSINIQVNDAKAAEPTSGSTPMLFTVSLSAPAGGGGVSVNYATQDQSAGAGHAVGGATCDGTADYQTASGTVNFASGERIKTVSVNVCADSTAGEPDETFLLNLSGAVGGTVVDAQAVGTITAANPAGTFIISELRTSGPGGLGDDFVELYNNTDTPLTVAASDASAGFGLFKQGTDCNATPVLIGTIPNGTIIPARGHFLFVGSQYGLGAYATGDQTMTSDIESDKNVSVFSTANVNNISSANRLDAVGFDSNTGGGVCDLLREGNTLPPVSGSTTQHSFFRKECDFVSGVGCTVSGNPKDTNDNSADFKFADTQGTFISGVTQQLGAPGPENKTSPIRRDSTILVSLLDNTKSSSVSPNRVRDLTSNPGNNSTFGTLSIRRRVTNNTGGNVTRIRFRIVEITTFPSPGGGVADLRPITSTNVSVSGITDAGTCSPSATPCTVTVLGTTLEQPPSQPNGGGINSTLAVGTITSGTPLAPGAAVNVQFLLGVQTTGTFRFLIITEALP